MAKVETYIEVSIKMSLQEARELRDDLAPAKTGSLVSGLWLELNDQLENVAGIK